MYRPPNIEPPEAPLRPRVTTFRPIARGARRALSRALRQFGVGEAALIEHWAEIVGPAWAGRTFPQHLSRQGRTLTVRVVGAHALELQFAERQICERIASFCGRPIVDRLKLVQGPTPARAKGPPAPPPIEPERRAALEARCSQVRDDALRAALIALGASIAGRRP